MQAQDPNIYRKYGEICENHPLQGLSEARHGSWSCFQGIKRQHYRKDLVIGYDITGRIELTIEMFIPMARTVLP